MAKTKKGGSRVGKHKSGKVRLGCYVDPHRKAVALLAAMVAKITMTDVIWDGVQMVARSKNIIDANGKVTPEFASQYEMVLEIVKQSEVNG